MNIEDAKSLDFGAEIKHMPSGKTGMLIEVHSPLLAVMADDDGERAGWFAEECEAQPV